MSTLARERENRAGMHSMEHRSSQCAYEESVCAAVATLAQVWLCKYTHVPVSCPGSIQNQGIVLYDTLTLVCLLLGMR